MATLDPNTQTPDLQAATGNAPPPQMSGSSILSALQNMQGPNAGLAAGSGVLNALGGGQPGANPYLAQHQVQQQGLLQQAQQVRLVQEQQARQAMQMEQLKQRMQEQALKRDDASRTVLKDLLFGPHAVEDESIRRPFVEQYTKALGNLKIDVPDSMKMAMAKGGPSQDSQKHLAILLASADVEPDPNSRLLLEQNAQQEFVKRGGKPEEWPVVSRTLRTPAYLKSINLPTGNDLKLEALKIQEKERAEIVAKFPELVKGDPKVIQDMIMQHRKYNGGKPYTEGTDESRQMAYSLARYNQAVEEESKLARQAQVQATIRAQSQEFQMMMQDKRFAQQQALQDQRLANQAASVAKQKHESAMASTQSFLNQFEALIPQLDDEGLLPTRPDWVASKWAATQRNIIKPESDVLRQWNELQSNFIGFSRGVQNDVIRAMAAQVEAARVNSSPPMRSGLEKIFKNMQAQLKASQTGVPQPAPNPAAGPRTGFPIPGKKPTLRYNPETDTLEPVK